MTVAFFEADFSFSQNLTNIYNLNNESSYTKVSLKEVLSYHNFRVPEIIAFKVCVCNQN